MKYRTREGDMLDQICLGYYGRVDVIAAVLEANPQLSELSTTLPAGLVIELPTLTLPNTTTEINLWD